MAHVPFTAKALPPFETLLLYNQLADALHYDPSSPATLGRVGDPSRSREMPIRPKRPGHDERVILSRNGYNIGSYIEQWVAARYQSQGWEVLAQNYRRRGTELDFIAWKQGTVAVVEVKARRSLPSLSNMIETLLPRKKQAALHRGALIFLQEQGEKLRWKQARLDLVVVALPFIPPIRVLFFPDV
jgi:putative endonuclease